MPQAVAAAPSPALPLSIARPSEPERESGGDTAIVLDRVSHSFAQRGTGAAIPALKDINLRIARGEIYGIIGRSGAGKSTLIRTINGLERPSTGDVIVGGITINRLNARDLRAERRKIGMIFQHFNLLSSRTAFDNIAFPLELLNLPRAVIRAKALALLDLVGLADKQNRYPAELSGGQKQRVGIARALATDPQVLLSDEATSALDPETTASILALLARVNAELGVTIMLITHEMAVIKDVCHSVGVMEAGSMIEEGPVQQVFSHPRTDTAKSFIGSLPGRDLPVAVVKQAIDDPNTALLRLTLTGEAAGQPIITRLGRELGIDITLLGGQIDTIGGAPFALLYISIPAEAWHSGRLSHALAGEGATAELISHVS